MSNQENPEIRDIKNGNWYWMHKAIIQEYAPIIGSTGIAVYNYLASLADHEQLCFPSQKRIAEKLGYSRSTVNKTIKILEKHKLVRKVKKNRCHCVYQLLRCKAPETQVSTGRNSGVKDIDTNDNTIERSINNIDEVNLLESDFHAFKGFVPKSREDFVALELADALNDIKGLPLYLSYSRKYPEALLRSVLEEVKDIPSHKIKKSRGALFNHLVQKYAKENPHHSGD